MSFAAYERYFREFFWPSKRNLSIFSPKRTSSSLNNNNDDEPKKTRNSVGFYYINTGDFDLAWPNIGVFIVGHLMLFSAAAWVLMNGINYSTIFWGENCHLNSRN